MIVTRLANIFVKSDETYLKSINPNKNKQIDAGRSLIRRVFKGIPPRIRPRVWPILLNVASAKKDRVYDMHEPRCTDARFMGIFLMAFVLFYCCVDPGEREREREDIDLTRRD
ncbi:hypothetical protein ACTXT7_002337 [Hymenolepis weldensis]